MRLARRFALGRRPAALAAAAGRLRSCALCASAAAFALAAARALPAFATAGFTAGFAAAAGCTGGCAAGCAAGAAAALTPSSAAAALMAAASVANDSSPAKQYGQSEHLQKSQWPSAFSTEQKGAQAR